MSMQEADTLRQRITVSYDGTEYAGWQRQPNRPTIQENIETVLKTLTGRPISVHACSRTDQGVHAKGLVIHCDLPFSSPLGTALQQAMNGLLPPDIRIEAVRRARPSFHARYDAKEKEYRYFIWNGPLLPPDRRLYWTWVKRSLDVETMRKAAHLLVGRHDFAAFTANPNRHVESTVRCVSKFDVVRHGACIRCSIIADGFLYKMVRSLMGFLIRVGEGAIPPETATAILESRVRTARVPTAPPQGLFLWRVRY